jgi:hypothetical protein
MINMGALFMSLILMQDKVPQEEKTKQAFVNGVATGGNPAGAVGAILLSQGRVQVEEEKQKLNQEIVAEKTVSNNLRGENDSLITANSTLTKELDGDPTATPPIIGRRKELDGDPTATPPIIGLRQQVQTMTTELDGDPTATPPIIGRRKELDGDPTATPPIIGLRQRYEDLAAKNIDLGTFLKKTDLYLQQQPAADDDTLKRVDHVKALFSMAIINKDDARKLADIAASQSPSLDKLNPILAAILRNFPT